MPDAVPFRVGTRLISFRMVVVHLDYKFARRSVKEPGIESQNANRFSTLFYVVYASA